MTDADLGPEETLPPSVVAAHRTGGSSPRRRAGRAYASAPEVDDAEALGAELAATQALLRAESVQEVGAIVATLVHDLGGGLVPARYADPAKVLPVDVSLGQSEPVLPYAEPISVASMRLRSVLPGFLEAALLVRSRLDGNRQRDAELSRDLVTGVLTRRAWMRRLRAARNGDSICMIDLDDFKAVNDTGGHHAGDAILRAVGDLLLRNFRDGDVCGRYGGDEFVCLTVGLSASALATRCDRVRLEWSRERPDVAAGVGLSIGVAEVGVRGIRAALHAADSAMYRGKSGGRDRTVLAAPDDYEPAGLP